MAKPLAYTAAEVAFVLREPVKTVKKALDSGPIETWLVRKAGTPVRAVDWVGLFYLFAVRSLQDELTLKARNEFYHALKSTPLDQAREVRLGAHGRLRVVIEDLRKEVEKRARDLAELATKVEFNANGEPVLKGTHIEVHRIAALLSGNMTTEEIIEDYPSLTPEMVATAKAYAEAHPKAGRPYPSKTVKRAIKKAGLDALREVLDPKE